MTKTTDRVARRLTGLGSLLVSACVLTTGVQPAQALTINMIQAADNLTDHPTFDPDLLLLADMAQAAADYWEDIILDVHTVDIVYGYADLGGSMKAGAFITTDDGVRPTEAGFVIDTIQGGVTPTERDWYFDQTPFDDSEFNMQQVLVRDQLSDNLFNDYYNGSPPDLLDAGYVGNYAGANLGDDLWTVVVHEVGHILGVTADLTSSAAELADGDYDFNPNFVHGASVAAEYQHVGSTESGHLQSPDAMMAIGAGPNDRQLASAVDVFAMAATAQWLIIDLPRRDFFGGTLWHVGFNWEGGAIPDGDSQIFIRHQGNVDMNANGVAGELIIRDDSTLDIGGNILSVVSKITIEEGPGGTGDATLIVEDGGRASAPEIEINDGGRLGISGSAFSSKVLADDVDINTGGVLFGFGLASADNFFNDGTITALNLVDANALRIKTNGGDIDLDGSSEAGQLFANLGDIDIDGPLNDAFDGEMTIGDGKSISFTQAWQLGQNGSPGPATVNLDGGANQADAAVVDGNDMDATRGQINVTGYGQIDADATLRAGLNVDVAANGDLDFEGTTDVLGTQFTVADGAVVRFDGPVTVDEATFNISGNGEVEFNGATTFSFNTLINSTGLVQLNNDADVIGAMVVNGGSFDLDGNTGTNIIRLGNNVNNGTLELNVDAIDTGNNIFNSTIETNEVGISGGLVINLTNPSDAWTMAGTLNLDGGNPLFLPTRVAGSKMLMNGQMNLTNSRVAIDADVTFGGTTNFAASTSELHLRGVTVIPAGATFNGNGTLVNGSTGDMTILSGGDTGAVRLRNAGVLRLGESPGQAEVGGFTQDTTGTWDVELAGDIEGDFDALAVDADADLAGTLNISLLGGFMPQIGDTFVLLTTGGGVFNEFEQIIFPDTGGVGLCVIYSNFNVMLTAALAGDLNGDGFVGIEDLNIILSQWNANVTAGTWGGGDPSGDGFVGIDDLNTVLGNWNNGTPPNSTANIPEPASQLIVLAGLTAVTRRRAC